MRSFDFYDTLAVRLTANPADIFSMVGERLGIAGFCSLRIVAERRAWQAIGAEVTYAQIYHYLALEPEVKVRASELELEFERELIAPVAKVISEFQSGDLIVSDMYHDEHFYRDVMARLAPGIEPGAVIVSGTEGLNKASGELWERVVEKYPTLQAHIYLMKESLDRLWSYRYEGAMLRYLKSWIDQLRWQRLKPMEKLADMLLSHLEGILNYCRTKVPLGVVEAVNGNIKALLRRGRGYRNLNYLLLKAQRLAATKTQLVAFQKAA
jgi:hypothetical protein